MEFLLFLGLVGAWIYAYRTRASMAALWTALDHHARRVEGLEDQVARMRREATAAPKSTAKYRLPKAIVERPQPPVPAPAPSRPAVVSQPVPPVTGTQPVTETRPVAEPRPAPRPPRPPIVTAPPPVEQEPAGWDLERLVGVKLFAAIAGIALVVAAISFLKVAMDQGWLQPSVRVLIGVVVAIGLLVACELKAARKYPATANAMDAAAIAILFATFFAAHSLWDLIPGSVTFGLLALVTALAVALSIRRDSLFIAVLGLLGGFATPVLLSTGENQPIPLFTYLLLLNIGLAWVAYKKIWPVLSVLTVILTTVYQWGWVFKFLRDPADMSLAMGIFIVFPVVTFAGIVLGGRRPLDGATGGADATFERTALFGSVIPLAFTVYLASVPAFGARAALLFGFLLLIDAGLFAIAVARRQWALHAVGAVTTVLVLAVWLRVSYVSEAAVVTLLFTLGFVVFYAMTPLVAAWLGKPLEDEGARADYAAPVLLFVFAVLAGIEPAFVDPRLVFGVLLAGVLVCAWRAIATGNGYLYYIAAFFAVAAQGAWSAQHLDAERLRTAVTLYAVFGVVALVVPVLARRLRRPLTPPWGSGAVLLLSLVLLFFLSLGGVSDTALWGLALLLAILNAGLFVETAGTRLPAIAMAGSALSWIVLASWWIQSAGTVGVLSSLAVLIGLTLVTLAGHALSARHASSTASAGSPADRAGVFLGLGGQLFLAALAMNREWSLPPWPLFGALFVMTLATSVAALYTRVAALHAAGVLAAAVVIGIWTTAAGAAPWPSVTLMAVAAVAVYALAWIAVFRRAGGEEAAAAGAGAVLVTGVLTTMAASPALLDAPAPLAAVAVSYAAHFTILLALAWWQQWTRMAIFAAVVGALASFAVSGPWHAQLIIAATIYAVFVAFPLALGRRVGTERDPFIAAIVASAAFFFVGRQAIETGGYGAFVGALPVVEAALLALLLRQLLRVEGGGQRDLGRLALVGGSALAFITVAIPLQLEHQWITIGWALEGAALAWLFTRVPHRGLLYAAVALLAVVFARLALNPQVFQYEPRGALRIFNWYLYTYLLAAASMAVASWWFSRTDAKISGVRPSQVLPAGAVILLFLLLNIEIADYYSTGPAIMFRFGAGVSQDLTYTIGWLVFGMLMLAGGIYAGNRPARVTAVALIAVTTFKCFLWDLRELTGLYRVGSFVGLAIALALVSLALQKYVLSKPREGEHAT